MVVNISMMFHENISNGFQATGPTRFYNHNHCLQCSKAYYSKSKKITVIVLVFCTSSHDKYFLKFGEIISNSFQGLSQTQFMTKITINNVKRAISQTESKPHIWLLCFYLVSW